MDNSGPENEAKKLRASIGQITLLIRDLSETERTLEERIQKLHAERLNAKVLFHHGVEEVSCLSAGCESCEELKLLICRQERSMWLKDSARLAIEYFSGSLEEKIGLLQKLISQQILQKSRRDAAETILGSIKDLFAPSESERICHEPLEAGKPEAETMLKQGYILR